MEEPVNQSKLEQIIRRLADAPLTRRTLIGRSATALGAGVAVKSGLVAGSHGQEIVDSTKFLVERTDWRERWFVPRSPESMMSREDSDRLFDRLNLAKRYPNTINKDAFNVIIQRPARLANFLFEPSDKPQEEQEREFVAYCEGFFTSISNTSDAMEFDFIATLLMSQISGDANSTSRAVKKDISDERMRVALGMARRGAGSLPSNIVASVVRKLELQDFHPMYYSLPRLEGVTTLGIHDIETVMIARALVDLEVSLPDKWPAIAARLEKLSPDFYDAYRNYATQYDQFEAFSDSICDRVEVDEAIQKYLGKFYDKQSMRDLLSTKGDVDLYQFKRTTFFWAHITELDILNMAGMAAPARKVLESQALERAIDSYMNQGSSTGLFLDQILNPKMVKRLKDDAERGDVAAKRLLEMSAALDEKGEQIIALDRSIAAALIDDKTEQNMEFQVLTGVAYTRWLTRRAHNHQNGTDVRDLRYDSPDELAYDVFLATSDRENPATFTLAGSRPLHRATLPFAPDGDNHKLLQRFLSEVYQTAGEELPTIDFRTFMRYFSQLYVEGYFPRVSSGAHLYELGDDSKMGRFIDEAAKFKAGRLLLSPPHSSWMRAIEATVGYIAKMKKTL